MTANYRNVVLVTADSIRADCCGAVGNDESLTPAIDAMAERGTVFTTAVSPGPRTPSSIPEILTGRHMPNDRIDPNDWERRLARVRRHVERTTTLAERFKQAGYSTVAYTSNPFTGTYTSFDAGFDHFTKVGNQDGLDLNVLEGTRFEPITKYLDQWWNQKSFFSSWEQYSDDMVETAKAVEEPFFLWVFLLDSHNPYCAPRKDREESTLWSMYLHQLRGNQLFLDAEVTATSSYREDVPQYVFDGIKRAYRDSIRSVDRCVAFLRRAFADDGTLLVFHSDHGEAFGEHGTFGHQRQLYEENVRVPFVVGNTASAAAVDGVVSVRTLPEMLYAYVTDDIPFTAERWQSEHAVLRTEDNSKFGLRTQGWKYIRTADEKQLYDLEADPQETRNVIENHPSTVEKFDRKLDTFIENLPRSDEPETDARVDSDVKDQLSELGYLE